MGMPPYKGAKRLLIDTTNVQDGEYEEIDLDRVIPGVHIPSEKFKAGYDRIDWKKRDEGENKESVETKEG